MEMLNFKDVLAFGFYEAHSPHTVAVLALLWVVLASLGYASKKYCRCQTRPSYTVKSPPAFFPPPFLYKAAIWAVL